MKFGFLDNSPEHGVHMGRVGRHCCVMLSTWVNGIGELLIRVCIVVITY